MYTQYPTNRYVSGTYKKECDVCGRDFLRSELKKRWDGMIVCSRDHDPKPRFLRDTETRKTTMVRVE